MQNFERASYESLIEVFDLDGKEAGRIAGMMMEELNTNGLEGFDTAKVLSDATGVEMATADAETKQKVK